MKFSASSILLPVLVDIALLCCMSVQGNMDNSINKADLTEEVTDCVTAKNRCLLRQTCRDSLITVMSQCATVAFGSHVIVDQCPIGCRNAIAGLMSSDSGAELLQCHCQGHKSCLAVRHRLESACRHEITQLTNTLQDENGAPISCSLAETVCRGDTSCSIALDYHHALCQKTFRGQMCTIKCRNSLDVLYSQEKAAKLKDCSCQGNDASSCTRRRQHVAQLCDLYRNEEVMEKMANRVVEEEITQLVSLDDDNTAVRRPSYKIQPNGFYAEFSQRLPATPLPPSLPTSSAAAERTVSAVCAWTLLVLNLPLFCLFLL